MGSNATLVTALAALVPASMLLYGSVFLFFKMRTVASFLQMFGAACLTIVLLRATSSSIVIPPTPKPGYKIHHCSPSVSADNFAQRASFSSSFDELKKL